MSVVRTKHTVNYSILPNELFDAEMSIEAKGLLAFFISLPDDWQINQSHICSKLKIGRDKYQRMMREIRECGYAKTKTIVNDDGTLAGKEVIVFDEQQPESRVSRPSGNPTVGKAGPIISKETIPNTKGYKKGTRIPEDWKPSGKEILYAQDKGLSQQEIRIEAEKFYNYWISAPGQRGIKLDWSATWRNWILNNLKRGGGRPQQKQSAAMAALEQLHSMLDKEDDT